MLYPPSPESIEQFKRDWVERAKDICKKYPKDLFAESPEEFIQRSQDIPDSLLYPGVESGGGFRGFPNYDSLFFPPSILAEEMKQFERLSEERSPEDWFAEEGSPEEDELDLMEFIQKSIQEPEDIPGFVLHPGLVLQKPEYYPVDRIETRKRNPQKKKTRKRKFSGCSTWDPAVGRIEDYKRSIRCFRALNFPRGYKFIEGLKYCISSDDRLSFWESDKCYDSTWLAVHGMESVCMVTWRRDVMTRVERFYRRFPTNEQYLLFYAQAVISEVEFLPYDDVVYNVNHPFRQSVHIKEEEKPFGVVSLVPDTKKVPEEASSAEYDVEKAAAFLKKTMKSGLVFDSDETIQTAISGFQHLCLKELKAEDIWVTSLQIARNDFKHLDLNEIKEHLAVIRGDSSGVGVGVGVSGPSSGFLRRGPKSIIEYFQLVNHGRTGCQPCNCLMCRSECDDGSEPSVVDGPWLPV